jgi:steroid 5-alpha reductase family enzyme
VSTAAAPGSSRATGFALVTLAYVVAAGAALFAATSAPFGFDLNLGFASLVMTLVLFAASFVAQNSSYFDPYWTVAPPLACGWLCFEAQPGTSDVRTGLVFVLVMIWAIRLTANWVRTWGGPGHEDWRYVEIQKKTGKLYWLASLVAIHLFPALLVWLGMLSLVPAIATGTAPLGWLDLVAFVVTGGAIAIEGIADEQLRRYRSRAQAPGAIMEEGLWAYSRHPNYFGEISFWAGLFLFGLAADGSSSWRVIGPISMACLFVLGTIPMMEKRSLEKRPAYAELQKRVSMLVPLPRRNG